MNNYCCFYFVSIVSDELKKKKKIHKHTHTQKNTEHLSTVVAEKYVVCLALSTIHNCSRRGGCQCE